MDSISAIPQQPQLGRLAQFLRYLETQNAPEFLPKQLDVMGLVRQLALPQASTVENLSYGNLPFTMPPEGTGAMIPQVKTGRKAEVADLISTFSGLPPGVKAVSDVGTKISNEAADSLVRMITRNPQATAPGVIQETAMPFMQAVAPKAPGLLAPRSELGFYSALEEAVGPLQNKGTGTQFLAQLEKTPGVKPEEIKWTGLDDFLKSKPNVTKAEVQDYLAQNRVNLQEVQLGSLTPEAQALRDKSLSRYRMITDGIATARQMAEEGSLSPQESIRVINSFVTERNQLDTVLNDLNRFNTSKFSSYTLPGGENYREILLTLPDKRPTVFTVQADSLTQEFKTLEEANAYKNQLLSQYPNAPVNIVENKTLDPSKAGFRSSHFDQPNILAHMRVNDRVVDGKKTLFIEEVQSDWHQAGRKKGYADKDKPWEVFDPVTANIVGRYASEGEATAAKLELNKAGGMFDIGKSEGVPDAPFKTTWHELTLKRAIQEAAEKGYDKIAFTTGKTQAERYDLSKQVKNISVSPSVEGGLNPNTRNVSIYFNNESQSFRVDNNGIIESWGSAAGFNKKRLEDVVGKEMAEKIMSTDKPKKFEGEDLKVGGEGMAGFYDQILPKSLEKLGKKFDAKVGKTDMDGVEVWSMDITPKMRESVLTKGQPLFQAAPIIPAAGLLDYEE